jgi:ketosteroid isomerase-like protein
MSSEHQPLSGDRTERQTYEVVQRFYDKALSADVDAIADMLDADAVLYEAESLPFAGTHVGRANVLQLLRTLFAGVALDSVVRGDVLVRGERAAAFLEVPFVLTDAQNPAVMPIVETFLVHNGLITEIRPYYFDTAAIAAAVAAAQSVARGDRRSDVGTL